MAIKNNDSGLKDAIMQALKTAVMEMPNIDESSGEIDGTSEVLIFNHPDAQKTSKFKSASKPINEPAYSTSKQTGMDLIVEAIAKEVLNYVVANADSVQKARYDALEDAYNLMLTTMSLAGTTLSAVVVTAPIGAQLTAIAIAGGGPTRAVTTTTQKALELTDIG